MDLRLSGDRFTNLHNFLNSADPAVREACVQACERVRHPATLLTAGDMALELARDTGDATRFEHQLQRARRNWQTSMDLGEDFALEGVQSQMRLATTGLMRTLYAKHRFPTIAEQEQVYDQMLWAAGTLLNLDQSRSQNFEDIMGVKSETAVELVLMRFGINHGEESWVAVPASASEDRREANRNGKLKAWDISIFTARTHELPPKPTYKVQVKSNPLDDEVRYEKSISIVVASQDLKLSPDSARGAEMNEIMQECIDEKYPNRDGADPQICGKTLDLRTRTLLDAIEA